MGNSNEKFRLSAHLFRIAEQNSTFFVNIASIYPENIDILVIHRTTIR